MNAEGWYRDPFGRHEARWFSAGTPTSLVRDDLVEGDDPPPSEDIEGDLEPVADNTEFYDDLARADRPSDQPSNVLDGSGALGVGFD